MISFSECIERAQAYQKILLIKEGSRTNSTPSFTKFVMSNTCGWTDRNETKVSGDAVNPLNFILKSVDGTTKELVNDEQE